MIRLHIGLLSLALTYQVPAHADSALDVTYGKWVKIDPANVLKEVPVYVPPRSSAGAASTAAWPSAGEVAMSGRRAGPG